MRCFWSAMFLLAAVAVVSIGAAETRAEMLANVAAGKVTTGTAPWSGTYAPAKAVDEQLRSVTGYVSGKNLTNAWWQVDLGAEFNFDAITIHCRNYTGAGEHINGAYLCAYDDTHTQIATQKLSGYNYSAPQVLVQDWDNAGNGWTGAQYLAVEDRDQVLNSVASGGCLWINELQAHARIPTYPTYITNVTATGNLLYNNGLHPDNQFALMVNGAGMTDQTGLSGDMLLGDPDATARQIHGGQWVSSPVSDELPYLIYDLGGSRGLDRMLVWNRNSSVTLTSNGVKDVTLSVSTDGVEYVELTDTNGDAAGTHTIAKSPGGNATYQADIDLSGVTARYVKLLAQNSHGGAVNEGWGIAEVRFYEVPEPSTLALVVIGALVLVCRWRNT